MLFSEDELNDNKPRIKRDGGDLVTRKNLFCVTFSVRSVARHVDGSAIESLRNYTVVVPL